MFVLPSVAIQFTRNIPCRHVLGSEELATTQLLFYFTKKKTTQHSTALHVETLSLCCGSNWKPFSFSFSSPFSLVLAFVCPSLVSIFSRLHPRGHRRDHRTHTGHSGLMENDSSPKKIISTFRIPSTALFSLQSPPAQNRETIKDSPARFRWLIDELLHRIHFMLLSKILISIHCVCECGEKEVSVLIERLRKSILQPSTSLSFHSSFVVSLRSTVDFYHTCKREAWWRYKFFNSHSSHNLDSQNYRRCGPVWTL